MNFIRAQRQPGRSESSGLFVSPLRGSPTFWGTRTFLGDAYPALTRWAKSCSAPPGLVLGCSRLVRSRKISFISGSRNISLISGPRKISFRLPLRLFLPPGLVSVLPALCDLGRSRSLAGLVTSRSLAGLGRSRSGCPYGCSSLRGWFWVVPPSGAGSRLFPTCAISEDLVH